MLFEVKSGREKQRRGTFLARIGSFTLLAALTYLILASDPLSGR